MKKIFFLLTIFLLLAIKITVSQDAWYPHGVLNFGNPPHKPNINSVNTDFTTGISAICGDSGYIASWRDPVFDFWQSNSNLITNKNLYAVYFVDSLNNYKGYIVGENGIVLKTDELPGGNIPFYQQNSPTNCNLFSVYFTSYHTGIAVGDTGTVIRTTDGGNHWNNMGNVTQNRLYSINFPSIDIGYAVGVNGTVIKTTDNGQNWAIKTQPIADTIRCVWFTSNDIGFVVSRNGVILKTTDGGENWQNKQSSTTENLNSIRFYTISIGYAAGNNNKILKTIDEGETWVSQTLHPLYNYGNFNSIGIDFYGKVCLVGSNGTAAGNFPESSIIKIWKDDLINFYPNPATDEVTVLYNVTGEVSNISIEISDITGRNIGSYTVAKNNNSMIINTQSFKKGIYYVMLVIDGKRCKVDKLIIQ